MNELTVTFGEYTYTFSPEKNAWYCDEGDGNVDIVDTSDIAEMIRSDAREMHRRAMQPQGCKAQ